MAIKRYAWLCTIMILLASCANRGTGPQGGPKDETPPKVLKEVPLNGSLNCRVKDIQVVFDEYIQLDNVADNVLISPPQQKTPEVAAVGKKLWVRFDEDLQDSTTYTIDFGAAICDNNEKNALEGYSFSFSTGDVIDSLEVSGIMLNAEDLNPISGIVVGIHTNLDDSALQTLPFVRIGRTNSFGEFAIPNMKPGSYRVYGLQDVSKDYMWQPGEGLALYDSIVVPTVHRETYNDTIWTDSLTLDTVRVFEESVFGPSDIVLKYFKENKQRRYFMRALREKPHYFTLLFAAPQDSLPVITPVDTDWMQYAVCQYNNTKDTITYWLTDSIAIKMDTIAFEMTYQKSDSLYRLQPQTDTVRAVYRAPRISERAKARQDKKKEKEKVQPALEIKTNAQSPFEIYNSLRLTVATPVARVGIDRLHLYEVIDSVRHPLAFQIQPADSAHIVYEISCPWKAASTYEFVADSAAFVDIYGSVNHLLQTSFTVRTLDEYSTLLVKVEPYDARAVVQILNDKDVVVRMLPVHESGARFEYLKPDSYYIRMFVDWNGDGVWTTGDLMTHRQPEPVYYFGGKLTLRANWDFEETFRYLEIPVELQKPDELVKDANAKKK